MGWLLLIGIILVLTLAGIFLNSKWGAEFKKRKEDNIPYNLKLSELIAKLKDTEKYEDWKASQILRKDILWLQTIYACEYSSRTSHKVYGGDSIDKLSILRSFRKQDLLTPESFSFSDKRHKIYTENIAIKFEDVFYVVNKTAEKISNDENYSVDNEDASDNRYSEMLLPFPKGFIEKALLFQYHFNKENPEDVFGVPIMRPESFKKLINRLNKFN
jgi:hypothetical protein